MRFLRVLAWSLLQGANLVSTSTAQIHLRSSSEQIAHDLGKVLSSNATIVLPRDAGWEGITARASYPRISPGYRLAVEVATEEDVAAIVTYANHHDIDFLVVAGGHGETTSLNRLRDGIQINLRKLNAVTVRDDETATVGGGTLQAELVSQLYSHGRRAVTGLCECVSVIGPLLGAGHSLLQSQFGFSADNIVSATVVLANGTTTHASLTTNPELFWALRDAGHNFGVVTSFTLRTYPIPSTYSMYTLTYSRSQIDALFTLVNEIDAPGAERDPKFFMNAWLVRPAAEADPVFSYTLAYDGHFSALSTIAAPFLALNPTTTTSATNITWDILHKTLGFGAEIYPCSRYTNEAISGVSLTHYNLAGLHKTYELFAEMTKDPRFVMSAVLLENFGTVKVSEIDAESTAVPPEERRRPILTSGVVHYEGGDEQTKKDAGAWLRRITDALYEGVDQSDRHAYVNYASGRESVREVYGREAWRLEKLKRLKKRWDPKNKFRFYAPLLEG